MTEWQLIETAPRDGRDIVAVSMDAIEPTSFVVCWSDTFNQWFIGGDGMLSLVLNEAIDVSDTYSIDPTHWIPLPEPPK